MNLFTFCTLVGKLTSFLQFQEFIFRNPTFSSTVTRSSPHNSTHILVFSLSLTLSIHKCFIYSVHHTDTHPPHSHSPRYHLHTTYTPPPSPHPHSSRSRELRSLSRLTSPRVCGVTSLTTNSTSVTSKKSVWFHCS